MPITDRAFRFWQRWLLIASACFCLFGLVVALFPHALFLEPWNQAVAEAFYDGSEPPSAVAFRAFILAPLGATIAGSYLLQTMIIAVPFARREPWAWWASVGALGLWFTVDSLLSWKHGAVFNVFLINLTPLVIFVPPLVATRKAFGAGAGGATRFSSA